LRNPVARLPLESLQSLATRYQQPQRDPQASGSGDNKLAEAKG